MLLLLFLQMGADQGRAPGKNWGKGRTKTFKFKEKPKKSDLELKEIKKLLEQYENVRLTN